MFGIILSTIFFSFILAVWLLVAYVQYRLVKKFSDNVKFWEMLIPIWSFYVLSRQVLSKPLYYMILQFAPSIISILIMWNCLDYSFQMTQTAFQKLKDYKPVFDAMNILIAIFYAYLWGQFAKALGKRRWLHFILAFLSIPLLITVPIMAFDKSQPVKEN